MQATIQNYHFFPVHLQICSCQAGRTSSICSTGYASCSTGFASPLKNRQNIAIYCLFPSHVERLWLSTSPFICQNKLPCHFICRCSIHSLSLPPPDWLRRDQAIDFNFGVVRQSALTSAWSGDWLRPQRDRVIYFDFGVIGRSTSIRRLTSTSAWLGNWLQLWRDWVINFDIGVIMRSSSTLGLSGNQLSLWHDRGID